MKKTPHYEVPLSQSRFLRRHEEKSSTPQNNKQEITIDDLDDRPERTYLAHFIHAPSAPSTEAELEAFTKEASLILSDTLNHMEAEGRLS